MLCFVCVCVFVTHDSRRDRYAILVACVSAVLLFVSRFLFVSLSVYEFDVLTGRDCDYGPDMSHDVIVSRPDDTTLDR